MKKLSLITGFAAGYVLGAKAGTQRYEQIMSKVDEVMGKPQVQKATDTITQTAGDLGDKAKTTVNDKVESVTSSTSAKKTKTVDLDAKPPITGASAPGAGATTGAAASGTAPDVAATTATTATTAGAKTTPR